MKSLTEPLPPQQTSRRISRFRFVAVGLVAAAFLLPCCVIHAETPDPQIARVTGINQASGNTEILVLWGSDLNPETLKMVSRELPFEESEALALLEKGIVEEERFPTEPPEGGRGVSVLTDDGRGFISSARLPSSQNDGRGVLWLQNGEGPWTTFSLTRPQIWWASPGSLHAGETIRIFGRDLSILYRKNYMALRHVEKGTVHVLEQIVARNTYYDVARNAFYEVVVKLPKDLLPGSYQLFAHNASGGNSNWSKPLAVEVLPPREISPVQVVAAAEHGAKGDGVADDTAAIRAALAAAEKLGVATVTLDMGTYLLSGTLTLPEGVSLSGRGRELTRLAPIPDGWKDNFPTTAKIEGYARDWLPFLEGPDTAPLLWMRNRSTVRDLTLSDGAGTGIGILVARAPGVAEQLRIENIRVERTTATRGNNVFTGILVMGDTYGLSIRNNEFTGVALSMLANRHEQFYLGFNRIRAYQHGFPLQANNLVFMRGTIRSIVEENFIENGDRNIGMQNGMFWGKDEIPEGMTNTGRTSYHTAWIGNYFLNNIPRRHNAGEIMFEGGAVFWRGKAEKIEAARLSVPEAPFNTRLVENWVAVVDGKGIGQYRKIAANTKNTLELEIPWDVMPDSDSTLAVGNFVVEHLWIDNTDEQTAGWTGFWGSHFGHVIRGQINRGGEGLYLWAYADSSIIGFVDIKDNWLADRGNIVLCGPGMIFGTTIAQNEVTSFYNRPSQHGTRPWTHPHDDRVLEARAAVADRPAILLSTPERGTFYPEGAPARDWNLIIRNLIAGGPSGIVLEPGADRNFVDRNILIVDGDEVVDQGADNTIGTQFGRE